MFDNIIKVIRDYPEIKSDDSIIHQWTCETDFDDYIESTYGNIHYKLINELLLFINNYDFYELLKIITQRKRKSDILMNQFTEMCRIFKKDIIDSLNIHFTNIIKLYHAINKIPDFITYNNNFDFLGKDLHLYRGFKSNNDKFFEYIENTKDISDDESGNKKNIITTPIFLSTSLIINVAKRFVDKNIYTNSSKKIIWKIIVPYYKLREFKYTYLGNDIDIDTYRPGDNGEFEFLLNIGALMQFKERKIIENEYYVDITVPDGMMISYTLETYEFVGWNYKYFQEINEKSQYFIQLFQSSKPLLRSNVSKTR